MDVPIPPSHLARQCREIRYLWLMGHGAPAIARRLGLHRVTIWKRIKEFALNGPEQPLERVRLALEVAFDACAERVNDGDPEGKMGELIRLAGEVRRMVAAEQEAADRQDEEADAANKFTDQYTSTVSDADIARWMGTPEDGLEEKMASPVAPATPIRETEPMGEGPPRYAGAAAGPLADMSVHGRTRRWKDPGWG